MKVNFLSDTWPWFDEHQCYGRVVPYIKKAGCDIRDIALDYGVISKLRGKLYLMACGDKKRKDSIFADSELRYKFFVKHFSKNQDINHILFYDTHFKMFDCWKNIPKNLIATAHHPIERPLPDRMKKYFKHINHLIVFTKNSVPFFEEYVGKDKVHFILHGVDTNYFTPTKENNFKKEKIKLFFSGQNGRNLKMLVRVFEKLIGKMKDIELILLVPERLKRNSALKKLVPFPNVTWLSNISENALRQIYRESTLLLLPMIDSGANNAVVEALACGLPVVTTDVGGIRDYGGENIYPLSPNDSDDCMIEIIEKYVADPTYYQDTSLKCRQFAEQHLDWAIIAQKYVNLYHSLLQ